MNPKNERKAMKEPLDEDVARQKRQMRLPDAFRQIEGVCA